MNNKAKGKTKKTTTHTGKRPAYFPLMGHDGDHNGGRDGGGHKNECSGNGKDNPPPIDGGVKKQIEMWNECCE